MGVSSARVSSFNPCFLFGIECFVCEMIQFFLIFNKLGQTRFAQYFTFQNAKERSTLEGEVTRMYMGRRDDQVSFSFVI